MMGTTTESNRNMDEDTNETIIPWKFVIYPVRQQLIIKLNPNSAMSGNDWRMLASKLGYTTMDINFIESDKGINTEVLFSKYDTKPGASFNEVYSALASMQRQDCLDILNESRSEIKEAFAQARDSQILHVAETSDPFGSGGHRQWSNPPCPCTYSPHPTATCGSHTCCPYNHGFASGGCAGHNHPIAHSPYCGRPLSSHTCQSASKSPCLVDTTKKAVLLSSSCHSSPKEPHSLHDRIAQPSTSGYGYVGNSPSSRIKNVQVNHTLSTHCLTGLSPGHSCYQGSSAYTCNDGDKPAGMVMVEAEPQNQQYQRVPSLQQVNASGVMISDVPTGVPEALPNNQVNNNSLISTDSSSSSNESFNSRQKFTRQYSDDCNNIPDSSRDKRFKNDGNSLYQKVVPPQGVTGHGATNNVGKPRNNYSPKFFQYPSIVNYVDYRDRHFQEDGTIKVENDQCSTDENNIVSSPPNCSGPLWDRSHPSSTFPMRFKTKQDRALEELKNLTISKKSTSMPQNMKPGEYRKAFRHIKVFVTYSNDNESHAKQVLSLCKFLQANGFACCVDVSNKSNFVKSSDQMEWCRRKVAEADFILVCISNKYLEDIASDRPRFSSNAGEHQLHTREIYDLMNVKHNGQHNSNDSNTGIAAPPYFIPLLFPHMTLTRIPQWMVCGSTYKWPEQYKDLAWMLTKPQERIKTKRETWNERERKGNDKECPFSLH